MFKKGILIFLMFFLCIGTSFAQEQTLSYEEFLKLYFGITTHEMQIPEQKPLLLYTNLKPSNPLYQLLQTAVANEKFANIKTNLPLKRPALESDLSLLLKLNYNQEMQAITGNKLTLEVLKKELQKLILTQKTEKEETRSKIRESIKQAVVKGIVQLLKTKFTEKEKLTNLPDPTYDQLSDFVAQLWEKYTTYYTPGEGKILLERLQNEFAGIGVYLLQEENQNPIVAGIIENTPAEKAGIKVGDSIISVDGKAFSSFANLETFIEKLKGEKWTPVAVEVKRGDQNLHFRIRREKFQIPLVKTKKIGTACYMRISAFDLGTKKKFDEEMKKLSSCQMFTFDLRNNPWGVVDEVVGILDEFLPLNKPILSILTQDKKEILTSKKEPIFNGDQPIAILINEQTASAAEIFAGVLKHYFPAKVSLIGEKSYGKGSVQEVVQFEEGSVLKYTIALRNIADKEQSINHEGLKPDLILHDNPKTPEDEVLKRLGLE